MQDEVFFQEILVWVIGRLDGMCSFAKPTDLAIFFNLEHTKLNSSMCICHPSMLKYTMKKF